MLGFWLIYDIWYFTIFCTHLHRRNEIAFQKILGPIFYLISMWGIFRGLLRSELSFDFDTCMHLINKYKPNLSVFRIVTNCCLITSIIWVVRSFVNFARKGNFFPFTLYTRLHNFRIAVLRWDSEKEPLHRIIFHHFISMFSYLFFDRSVRCNFFSVWARVMTHTCNEKFSLFLVPCVVLHEFARHENI